MKRDEQPLSFAAAHADPSRGFRAAPRWFRNSDFWRSLEGSHRAVLDQLYMMIASERVVQHGTGIVCERGQWAIGYEALGEASGTSKKAARRAIERALHFRVISQEVITKRLPGRTLHLSLFTWLDFDSYDLVDGEAGTSLGTPVGTSLGTPVGTVRHHSNTPTEDTNPNTHPAAAPTAGGQDADIVEQIYQAYPRPIGKAAARKAIEKAMKEVRSRGDAPDDAGAWLLARTTTYAAARRRVPSEKQFTPYPATWFNQGRYDDDAADWLPQPSSPTRSPHARRLSAAERGECAEDLPVEVGSVDDHGNFSTRDVRLGR